MKMLKRIVIINIVTLLLLVQTVPVYAGWEIDVFVNVNNKCLEEQTYVDYDNTSMTSTQYTKTITKSYETTTTTTNSEKLTTSVSGLGAAIDDVYSWSEKASVTYTDLISKTIPARSNWVLKGKIYGKYASGWAEFYRLGIFLIEYTGWTISTPMYVKTVETLSWIK